MSESNQEVLCNNEFIEMAYLSPFERHMDCSELAIELSEFEGYMKLLKIKNCSTFDFALNLLTNDNFETFFQKSSQLIQIHVIINEEFKFFDDNQFNEIGKKLVTKSFLVSLQSHIDKKFFICWKFREHMKYTFEVTKNLSEDLEIVCDFLRNFLQKCYNNGETGLPGEFTSNSFIKPHELFDSFDRTILMIAAEEGNLTAVNFFIKANIPVTYSVNNQIAIDYAYNNKHYEVVHSLLWANSPFPKNFNANIINDELKMFVDLMEKMHENILNENKANITKIILENPELRYFYNIENLSAMALATQEVLVESFEILMLNNLIHGSNENYNKIVSSLSFDDGEKLRQVNFKNARNFTDNHIMMLMANSTIRYGTQDKPEKLNYVLKAFNILNKNETIKKVLELSAAARNLKLVFDFENEILQYLDPTAGPYTNGSFYLNCGQIAIAAKKLLDPESMHIVLGALAHELCHFAMHLLHNNNAKPFAKDDEEMEKVFTEIHEYCEKNKDDEIIISWVYSYNKDKQFAELIVRVPHILAHYYNDSEKTKEIEKKFQCLFDFFYNKSIPEMVKKIPELEEKYEMQKQQKVLKQTQKISVLKKIILLLMVLVPIGIIVAVLLVYSPIYSWNNMSDKEKIEFKNSTVEYHGVNVKFKDLFANDSNVYELLSSEQITFGLNNNINMLSKAIATSYEHFVYLKWENMTYKLKAKFMKLKVNFQGEILPFEKITVNPSIFLLLNSFQIQQTFNDKPINISTEIRTKTKCFIERKLLSETLNDRQSFKSLDVFLVRNKTNVFLLSNQAGEGKSTAFRHVAVELKKKDPKKWIQFVDLKKYSSAFEDGKQMNLFHEKKSLQSFNETEKLKSRKKFLTFLVKIFKFNEIEKKIFIESYELGNVVLFWDGVDEISPNYKDFILNLTNEVKSNSENFQFISTRPQYSKEFREILSVDSYKLVTLDKPEGFQLLVMEIFEKLDVSLCESNPKNKSKSSKNIWREISDLLRELLNFNTKNSSLDVENILYKTLNQNDYSKELKYFLQNSTTVTLILNSTRKGEDIIQSIEKKQSFRLMTNPLLIRMIAEICSDQSFVATPNFNSYSVFHTFMDKKFQIFQGKGEVASIDTRTIFQSTKINVMQIHQAYAIKLVYGEYIKSKIDLNISEFSIMSTMNELSYDQITRFGILHVYSENKFSFAHRTFSEFLVCRFLIDSINSKFNKSKEMEARLFNSVMFGSETLDVVKSFLQNYVYTDVKLSPFFEIFKSQTEKYTNILSETFVKECQELVGKCVQKDSTILKFLSFTEFSEYFKPDKIELGNYLIDAPFSWTYYDFEKLMKNWDRLNKTLGEHFHYALSAKLHKGETLLFNINQNLPASEFQTFLDMLTQTLNKTEIRHLISSKNIHNQTILMIAAYGFYFEALKGIWSLIESNFDDFEIEEYLLMEDKTYETSLQYAAGSSESECFSFIKEQYQKNFNESKIQEILLKLHDDNLPFVFMTIDHGDKDTVEEVISFLGKLFENDAMKLREILMHHNKANSTIFSTLKYMTASGHRSAFENLLRDTFLRNEKKEFDEYLRILLIEPRVNMKFSSMNAQNFKSNYLFRCFAREEYFMYAIDFGDLIQNQEIIKNNFGIENFKILLTSKNFNDENLLHILLTNETSLVYFESFLNILEEYLNETELYNILSSEDSVLASSATPLMLTASKGKEYFEIFLRYLNNLNLKIENLANFDVRKFLLTENEHSMTSLQFSTFNTNPNTFIYVKNIYETFFGSNFTKELILKGDKYYLPFIYDLIESPANETSLEISNYFKTSFKNEKIELRHFLSIRERDGYGDSIFQYFRNKKSHEKNLNIFKDLLKFTFDDEEEFKKYLLLIEQNSEKD